jgi:hypothetical protein
MNYYGSLQVNTVANLWIVFKLSLTGRATGKLNTRIEAENGPQLTAELSDSEISRVYRMASGQARYSIQFQSLVRTDFFQRYTVLPSFPLVAIA